MASKRVRFGEITLGQDFEWGGRMLRKESDLRAVSIVPRQEFLFKKSDLVILQLPDDEDEDDLYPMYGLGGMGSANPSVPHPLTSDDLSDMYGIPFGGADRCN
jgi:hypothetical protein